MSVIVWWTRGRFGVGGGPIVRDPAVVGVSARSFSETSLRASIGQRVNVCHWSAAYSMSAWGSVSTSLRTPWSSWSNHRCSVATHSDRRKSNGSMCPVRVSQSFFATFAGSASHHFEKWSGITLSSCRPCTTNTLAFTLPASGL